MSHPFIPLFSSWIFNFAQCVCVCEHGRVCVMDYCVYNKRVSVSMLVKTLHGGGKKQQVSLLKEDP